MAKIVGVTLSDRVVAGLIVDHQLSGPLRYFPELQDDGYALVEMPTEEIVRTLCDQVMLAAGDEKDIAAVGIGLPGLVRNGVVEEAPNLPQLKGARIAESLSAQLLEQGLNASVNGCTPYPIPVPIVQTRIKLSSLPCCDANPAAIASASLTTRMGASMPWLASLTASNS